MVRLTLPAALIAVCTALSPAWGWAQVASPEPAFSHCEIEGTGSVARRFAECASLTVAENPNAPDGRTLDLAITRIATPAAQPAADAVLVINGGPGGSSIELLADFWPVFASLGTERDVIAMDQRGTGASRRLACPELEEGPTDPDDTDAIDRAVDECLTSFDADTRYYTTSVAVHDIDAVRDALGYEQLTVYGVSYGTRVAQHYARQYPDRTRAVILDGVVPPDVSLVTPVALNSAEALDDLFERCARDEACTEAFADPNGSLSNVRQHLEAQSRVSVSFSHPVTNEPTEYEITYDHFASIIRFMLYAPESSAAVPLTIDRAAREHDFRPIAAQAMLTLERIAGSMASGMHNSVMCTEDYPFATLDDETLARLEETYLTAGLAEGIDALCSRWPRGTMDANLRDPLTTDLPVLVLSGEHDPITPPGWGEAIMPGLANARHLIAPGQGHGVIARGCVPKLAARFINELELSELDESCLEDLVPFPFFTDLLGPAP